MLLLALLFAPPPWQFRDDSQADGRSVSPARPVELAATPARPLHPDDKPPPGSRYGSAQLGPSGAHRIPLVWHAATNTLWLDADADGRYTAAERVALNGVYAAAVTIPFGNGVAPRRTLLIRRRGDGVAWAVRGYTQGPVEIAGKPVPARLTDGDADGAFDSAGRDRVWLDLDGDGHFDPLAEQFLLGTAVNVNGTMVLLKSRADGLGLTARERPAETGTLAVRVSRLPLAELVELTANYVSEFGELIAVRGEESVTLPAGKYRLDAVELKLADADGAVWSYRFYSPTRERFPVVVSPGRRTNQLLLDGLEVKIALTGDAAPGDAVRVAPSVVSGGLTMTSCQVGGRHRDYGQGKTASIVLSAPGSVPLDRCESAFF